MIFKPLFLKIVEVSLLRNIEVIDLGRQLYPRNGQWLNEY